MYFDDLKEEEKVLFLSELRKYYPKREVDLSNLVIKVVEIDDDSWTRLSFLRISTRNKDAFLFIGFNDCEFYIENKKEKRKMKKVVRVVLELEVDDVEDVLESGNTHQVRLGGDGDGDLVLWLDSCATENTSVIEMEVL